MAKYARNYMQIIFGEHTQQDIWTHSTRYMSKEPYLGVGVEYPPWDMDMTTISCTTKGPIYEAAARRELQEYLTSTIRAHIPLTELACAVLLTAENDQGMSVKAFASKLRDAVVGMGLHWLSIRRDRKIILCATGAIERTDRGPTRPKEMNDETLVRRSQHEWWRGRHKVMQLYFGTNFSRTPRQRRCPDGITTVSELVLFVERKSSTWQGNNKGNAEGGDRATTLKDVWCTFFDAAAKRHLIENATQMDDVNDVESVHGDGYERVFAAADFTELPSRKVLFEEESYYLKKRAIPRTGIVQVREILDHIQSDTQHGDARPVVTVVGIKIDGLSTNSETCTLRKRWWPDIDFRVTLLCDGSERHELFEALEPMFTIRKSVWTVRMRASSSTRESRYSIGDDNRPNRLRKAVYDVEYCR